MTTLKTLEEHNKGKVGSTFDLEQRPNGIGCPLCGKELVDSNNAILTSNPPQKNIHCPDCDYSGYRLA